ncbi:type VI secretion system baseplate subunit TssG [Janthinobacterium sp. PC23-8]|uniref:type VI secretion system baseplate subunit TssG n=1 Tax=Janthinobacterium sp. PC23-8 TaxID=2012679 RepID=UPI00159502DD|nr:type VI secretion system baseplate subunit TssG [Janthinobacterium sp. PC23-8]
MFEGHDQVNIFQLMRLLTRASASAPAPTLRFRADLSAAFPAREFSSLNARQGGVVEIGTANYCVASILGPLPEPFTEWVRDLERARAPAMADFLNIFNQRLNTLRFELKAAQKIALNTLPPEHTGHAHVLASLMGVGSHDLRRQLPLPPRAWLALAGLLANSRRSASTVTRVLSCFLGAQVSLIPMLGAWHTLEGDDQNRLGQQRHQLGQDAVLGRRVWDQQARVRLVIAGVSYARLCRLLPPNLAELRARQQERRQAGADFAALVAMVHLLLDRQVDCEIELQIDDDGIPAPALPAAAPGRPGWRLGQTAWLRGARTHRQRRVHYLIPAHGDSVAAR